MVRSEVSKRPVGIRGDARLDLPPKDRTPERQRHVVKAVGAMELPVETSGHARIEDDSTSEEHGSGDILIPVAAVSGYERWHNESKGESSYSPCANRRYDPHHPCAVESWVGKSPQGTPL